MDRRFKERLIGAVVLAGAAVLILPAVLNGPHAPVSDPEQTGETAMHSETIELEPEPRSRFAPADPDPATVREIPARAPATPGPEPSPTQKTAETGKPDTAAGVAGVGSTPQGAAGGTAASSPPATSTAPARATPPVAAAPATPTGEGWAVQVGTFASSSNATALAASLEARGYAAFVSPVATGGKTLYRVRVGPTADVEAARALEQRLEKEGRQVDVVRQP